MEREGNQPAETARAVHARANPEGVEGRFVASNVLVFTATTAAIQQFQSHPEATQGAVEFLEALKSHDVRLIHQGAMTPEAAGYKGPLDAETFTKIAGMVWDDTKDTRDKQHQRDVADRSGYWSMLTHLIAAFVGAILYAFLKS